LWSVWWAAAGLRHLRGDERTDVEDVGDEFADGKHRLAVT
jgi:hypothetical protein